MNRHTLKRKFLSLVPVAGLCFLIISPADGATYYVRPDGGTATQCTGLTDAPYPGSGSNKECAFSHPFWAHAPKSHPTKLKGGDTLIIDGSNNAEYMMGYGAPNGTGTDTCHPIWPQDCFMRPIPSGPDAVHPTRILGKGWDTGCENPPQLWGTERTDMIINMLGSDNVELQCMEITDHSSCQEFGPGIACNRSTKPYGPWASNGLRAMDSDTALLTNINIHGIAHKGVWAGRLKDWTIEDSRIYANSIVGWDGDVGAFNSSNSGTMAFTRVVLQYSGCGETYPGGQPHNCYSQSQGGYGDGLGTHETGANWVFNNVDISHNVSDGLDLLYHDGKGTITIKRSRFEGNAGNQVKIAANAVIENSIIIGNCNYFQGKSFTSTKSPGFDNCRAGGNSIAFALHPGTKAELYNSTVTGVGDTLVMSTQRSNCNGTETITSRNNIFLGDSQFGHPDTTDLYYAAGKGGNGDGPCGQITLNDDYSVIWGTKSISTNCKGKNNSYCENPKLAEPNPHWYTGEQFNVNLLDKSPARNRALVLTGKSSLDYNKFDRGNVWDIGAIEYGIAPTQPTCKDEIQYCLTQTDCVNNGHFWYNNICNAQPKPKTCADGIQYCTTQTACEGQGYYWYDNSCHAEPKPEPQSQPAPQPKQDEVSTKPAAPTTGVPEESGTVKEKTSDKEKPSEKKEPSQETTGSNTTETPGSASAELASPGEATTGVSEESGAAQGKPSDEEKPSGEGKPAEKKEPSQETAGSHATGTPDSGSAEFTTTEKTTTTAGAPEESSIAKEKSSDKENHFRKEEPPDKEKPSDKGDSGSGSGKGRTAGGGGAGKGGGGKSSGGSSGGGTSLIGAGGGTGVPTNIFEASPPAKSRRMTGESSSSLVKGAPQAIPSQPAKGVTPAEASQSTKGVAPITASQPTAGNKSDSVLITPSLPLTDNTSISLNRNDIAAQAEVASEPTVEPDENVNLAKTESETPLNKTIAWISDFWRSVLRWFSGN